MDGSLQRCGSLFNYEEGYRSAWLGTTVRHRQHLLFYWDGVFMRLVVHRMELS